ncbi:hypothetical protein BDV95DRAFT_566089 [Massariosphaeria phaeospora]|uniref:Uncharacterized protein n=1 Tax=Massariosphaeria phaeospora TaxID=100035 RepID=A0A7C8IA03_9PLEO|nr:hypothetical protein BDV95DRAFT_566089 [Massariosphaeria phaeospora]
MTTMSPPRYFFTHKIFSSYFFTHKFFLFIVMVPKLGLALSEPWSVKITPNKLCFLPESLQGLMGDVCFASEISMAITEATRSRVLNLPRRLHGSRTTSLCGNPWTASAT